MAGEVASSLTYTQSFALMESRIMESVIVDINIERACQ
jgi:hypothetical protein